MPRGSSTHCKLASELNTHGLTVQASTCWRMLQAHKASALLRTCAGVTTFSTTTQSQPPASHTLRQALFLPIPFHVRQQVLLFPCLHAMLLLSQSLYAVQCSAGCIWGCHSVPTSPALCSDATLDKTARMQLDASTCVAGSRPTCQ